MNQQQKPGLLVPALIGGAVAGVLSGIPLLGCLCCLWIIGGAMLASSLASKQYPVSMTAGDGAILGALVGIVAAVVHALISLIPQIESINENVLRRFMERFAEFAPNMPSNWRDMMDQRMGQTETLAMFLFGLLISAVVFVALGALGGIIGASLFGKKTAPAAGPQTGGGPDVPKDPSHS